MGKTSIMLKLLDEPEEDRLVFYLNVEELAAPKEFCFHLLDAIHEYQQSFLFDRLARGWDHLNRAIGRVREVNR